MLPKVCRISTSSSSRFVPSGKKVPSILLYFLSRMGKWVSALKSLFRPERSGHVLLRRYLGALRPEEMYKRREQAKEALRALGKLNPSSLREDVIDFLDKEKDAKDVRNFVLTLGSFFTVLEPERLHKYIQILKNKGVANRGDFTNALHALSSKQRAGICMRFIQHDAQELLGQDNHGKLRFPNADQRTELRWFCHYFFKQSLLREDPKIVKAFFKIMAPSKGGERWGQFKCVCSESGYLDDTVIDVILRSNLETRQYNELRQYCAGGKVAKKRQG